VAVKVIRDFAGDPLRGKRTLRELKVLAHLRHKNLLGLYDILPPPSPDFDDIYIVTSSLQLDLHKLIYQLTSVKLVEAQCKAFLVQMLLGLQYMHSAGVMHRDLKPSNILVNQDLLLKIADFGLARGIDLDEVEEAAMTEYVVTRWYRAPELLLFPHGYTQAVDLWSVGCIHVELLSRKPLFPGKDHWDQLWRIAEVLGFCSERDLGWVPEKHLPEVKRMLGRRRLPQTPEKPLRERVRSADESCAGLVATLLDKVPTSRASSRAALAHPYLADLASRIDALETAPAQSKFDWTFEQFEATRRAIKDRVYAECARHHPEIIQRDEEWLRSRGF
jgi:serine/threonine protein kinase